MKHFVRKPEEYRRNLDPLGAYQRDAATFLKQHHPHAGERIKAFVERCTNPETGTHLKMPQTRVLVRQRNGDRKMELMRFDQFMTSIKQHQRILAPTLTVYENPKVRRSMLGDFLADNLARRKTAKHEMFVAERAGDKIRRAIKNSEQNTLKIKNNAMSGAHSSPHTILFNKSSHSALTSTCRAATSYGNANNEKFLCGNRHYHSPEIVKNNIISIVNLTDLQAVAHAAQKYMLTAPSVEQTMECIERSTNPYWRHAGEMAHIRVLVETLSDLQRMAFVFVGDFYHLAQVNPQFVRGFLGSMVAKANSPMHGSAPTEEQIADRVQWVKQLDSNLLPFVSMVCAPEMKGRSMKDVPSDSDDYGIVAATGQGVILTLDRYEEFIRAFWVTDNMPASVYWMPSIVRQGAITSDTDSTIFTVQYWPEWFRGQIDFTPESIAVANAMVFFSSETIRHILALFSANLGADVAEIHRLSMKNEFYFLVFCLTSRAKHYFARVLAQEGNYKKVPEIEIKGVALRSSNVPPAINKQAKNLMDHLMDTVIAGKKISLIRVLRAVAKIEEGISDEIKAGGFNLLPSMTIRSKESYTDPMRSNYIHYDLWESVFAPKYGPAPAPPYVSIKVNLTSDNRSRCKEWLDSIQDRALAARLEQWMERVGRKELAVIMLPQEILASKGLPEEVIPAANIRGLIAITMTPFYLLLESIGFFIKNKNNSRLVSDERWLLSPEWYTEELDLLNPEPSKVAVSEKKVKEEAIVLDVAA